ncbi:hypothetical protein [Curtobacterium sp. BRB10]|uniref:hypothetical protein n=1 Tax=Curtobacterium sp. BRB10 TaxID=2962579 RepID=UPI00288198AD|nr:hypothetical protein [Curtobacterium sp. BRB10]MDT0234908.1 hypothetical protein [Curtobacterium sp. BRB10]
MDNVLRAGEVRTGFLTDGQHPDLVAASLTWTERGPELSVPGAPGRTQFEIVEDWFRRRRGGIDLLFTDDRGPVTLSDVRYAGHHGNEIRVTKATARNAICQHPRQLPKSTAEERLIRAIETPFESSVLSVEELYSTVDGLARFSGFGRIEVEETDPDHPERISLTRDLNEKLTWTVDVDELPSTLQYEVLRTTPWRENDDGVTVQNEVVVQTRWLGGNVQPEILLWQQYPLRSLLVLAYSRPIQWRTHHVRGQSFPTTHRGTEETSWVPAFIADTAQGTFQDSAKLDMPLFGMQDLGPDGMQVWFERWLEDDSFRNPMQSAIEALSGFTRFLEPRVMLLINTLEALGGWVTGDPHKRMSLAKAVENCARASGGEWSNIGDAATDPEILIARFLATLQNDLKHGQRGQRRSRRDLRFAERLSAALIRMTALHEIPIDEDAARYARASLVEDVENELGQDELATIERPNGTDKNGDPKTITEGVLRRAAPSGT